MKTKLALALAALCVCMLSGCYAAGRLYPIQGPLASQAPPPIFAAKASAGIKSGSFTATLANGEACKGNWTSVSTAPTVNGGVPANNQPQSNLAAAWDTVYGQGFYVAHVLGQPLFVHTELTGNQGTMLQVEWYDLGNENNNGAAGYGARGVAQDSKGNIYKLVM